MLMFLHIWDKAWCLLSYEQFKIPGFSTPLRRERDQYGGGLLVFVREDMQAKHLSNESTLIEGIYIEPNFRNIALYIQSKQKYLNKPV